MIIKNKTDENVLTPLFVIRFQNRFACCFNIKIKDVFAYPNQKIHQCFIYEVHNSKMPRRWFWQNLILLSPLIADIIMSLVSIAYGMRWECHYTAWMSVLLNVIFTAIFLSSNDFPVFVILILIVYVLIGVVVAKKNYRQLYSLFGTKTFGALTLTASLGTVGILNWFVSILSPINVYFNISIIFLIFWLVIGSIVHFLGWYYFGR